MNNILFSRLLEIIEQEKDAFNTLVDLDNTLGLGVTSEEIIGFLEFNNTNEKILESNIDNNIIITEGNILSILKIIHDLAYYEGEYILYINKNNRAIITYLITKINNIYKELDLDINIKIDYSDNYNRYLNEQVTIVGSDIFVNTACKDFDTYQMIIV